MFDKKIMILAMILIGLLAITAVSAAENTTQDIASINENIEEELDISQDEILTANPTIANLNTTINDNTASEINLTADYAYTDSDTVFQKGIEINRDLTINGKGHKIDGGNDITIFHVTKGTVVFKNIIFIKGEDDFDGYGGAICAEKDTHVTAIDCIFSENSADYGGAICRVTAINCTFNSNEGSNGGATYFSDAINCTFNSNKGSSGGAMYCGDAINCTFNSNYGAVGGAFYIGHATNCTFILNTAMMGGAIFSGHATNCTFISNRAWNRGGAMDSGSAIGCTFISNRVEAENGVGGAIYDAIAINCTFNSNTAANGGAIAMRNDDKDIRDCIFIKNSASKGGAISGNSKHNKIYNCRFIENHQTNAGTAIYWEGNYNNIYNCTFINNTASQYAGAVYQNGDGCKLYNCTFINNTASEYAGAVCQKGDGCKLYNCIFINNSGNQDGAVRWYGNDGNIYNCLFTNNHADNTGALNIANGNTSIYNCSFINNHADNTGALNIANGNTSIYNCSFIKNTAVVYGIIYSGGGNINIYGCIFMENRVGDRVVIVLLAIYPNKTVNNNIFLNNTDIFLNNTAKAIGGINQTDTTTNTNYNWYGNNATNYADDPKVTNCNIWLFLDGETDMDFLWINETCNITFKLYAYNSTSKEIIEYDNSLLKPLYMTVKSTGSHIDKDTVKLGESVAYTETTTETVKVTAQIKSASQTVEIFFSKKDSNLSFDNQTVDYSENTIITIGYNPNATGTLNITLKGKKYSHTYTDVKLNATIPLGNLMPDEYNITIIYSGDDYFLNETRYGELVVRKLDSNLHAVGYDINVTDTHGMMFKVTLNENATGTLTLPNGTAITVEKGIAEIEIFNNAYPFGEYVWAFTYSGDDIYANSTAQATSNILAIPTEIIPTDKTIELDFGDESKITYTTKPADLEGITYESTNPNVITIDADGIINAVGAGSAEIILRYGGNATYAPSNATVTITVRKINSTLTVPDISFEYDTTGSTTVTYTGATGVKASVNDSSAMVEINGNIITVSNLNVGNYTITVTTIPDANHNEATKTANITVRKADSTLPIPDIAFDYTSTSSTTVTYTGATGFTAEVLNQPKAIVIINGNTITVSNLDAGTYTLSITTIADANHNNITKTVTITINKLKTELTANAITTTYGINKNLVISLKDSTGKPISGVQITVSLNGEKTYTTDSNGQVTIKTGTLVPKAYTIKIAFKGNANYEQTAKNVKVTVKKAKSTITAKKKTFKKTKKIKKYTITLKANKKPIKKVWVTLKIKGKKTIKAKTNKKGKATFKIKKLTKKGKYKATIKFKGNKYYNAVTKKVKIKIK